jgi:ElaB/YqjD/DUF883 family membrane-anchored ribosome-binding protein
MEPQTYPRERQSETDSSSPDISSTLQSVKARATEAADQFRHAAGEKIVELQEAAGTEARHLKMSAKEYVSQIETYIRAKPVKSAIASVGVGLILGLLMRR